jgi:putative transposase
LPGRPSKFDSSGNARLPLVSRSKHYERSILSNYRKLQHSEWECTYHVVFIPKYRRKVLYGALRQHLGEVFRRLARQKESEIEEGHLMGDHVHMMIWIPPKYSVAQVIG